MKSIKINVGHAKQVVTGLLLGSAVFAKLGNIDQMPLSIYKVAKNAQEINF
jgi:hypothetical protein